MLLGALVVASSCEKAKAPGPAPVPVPPPQQLTERDTEPHGGALSGEGWRLPLDERWLVVKREARTRFKPQTLAWAVDPIGPVHLTVECIEAVESVEASLRAQLALGREKHELEAIALGAAPAGPWLEGALAQWAVSDMGHVMGRFRLLSTMCDVHAWAPRSGGAPAVERLKSTVLAFGGTRTALMRELTAMATWVGARARQAPDAGPLWLRVRTEDALRRAPPALLVERFTMRLKLLEDVGPTDCARIVNHRLQESPALLERLPEPVAVRWVQVTREALELAEGVDTPMTQAAYDEMKAAVVRLANEDAVFAQALDALKQADRLPDEIACDAERVRLTKMLAQPPSRRALLLRSLL
ncbi:MAG: hypothetical protein Q8S33_37090 [Myxococcales bacterium]|nr:hypothetical protein [Myxococcales bacterium]